MNAGDGQEAIDITMSEPDIVIVLMDIQLPVLDGYDSARRIREFRKNIIIIAQTAFSLLGDQEKIITSGFDDYIVKPIFPHQLIEKLESLLVKE